MKNPSIGHLTGVTSEEVVSCVIGDLTCVLLIGSPIDGMLHIGDAIYNTSQSNELTNDMSQTNDPVANVL